ncbi:ubiquitin-conjugating enzyme/RWD-like protein [Globomyces pollinis-pini]|nr:ubiquitin-conjugating enzyme/RWD-like protein [Globomyces pollinis-pini]
MAAQTLAKQFKELTIHPVPGFVVELKNDNIFEWSVGIIGPPKTIYQGGYFLATIKFPSDYPFNPPTFTFNSDFFHPNVYKDGKLCISILHPPGDDPTSGETAAERWNPTQSVESILLSIVSLINDPNCSSPANVDAGVMYRSDRDAYNAIVQQQVNESKKNIPEHVNIPTTDAQYQQISHNNQLLTPEDDSEFWGEEDDESFGIESEED